MKEKGHHMYFLTNQIFGLNSSVLFSSVTSHVQLFATPWTAAHLASLSITNSRSLLKLMSIESVMPSNHLILCHPLLLLPSIFPSIRVFSNESVPPDRWPMYWSFIFNISPSNEYPGLISFRMDWLAIKTMYKWDFSGGLVVMNLPCNTVDVGSIPGPGTRIPHAVEQLGLHITTIEPTCHN